MKSLILYRLAMALPLLVLVSLFTFILVSLSPGDAARTILGANATPEQYAALREALGLNDPVLIRYWQWLGGAFGGDFGRSLINGQPVLTAVIQRLGPTVSLISLTMVVTIALGLTLGVAGAVYGGRVGRTVDLFSLFGMAVPNFVLGVCLTAIFAVMFRLLPPGGYVAPTVSLEGWAQAMVLPVVCLSFFAVGILAQQVKASFSDALQSEYTFNLIANGFTRRSIICKHALKNCALPVLASVGVIFSAMLSGTVLVESLFYIPGLGSLAVMATAGSDLAIVQGVAVIFTLAVVIVNVLLDLAYGALDPKLRTGGS